jgi:hypothetical protein
LLQIVRRSYSAKIFFGHRSYSAKINVPRTNQEIYRQALNEGKSSQVLIREI